jgi:hypothetical protein
MLFSGGAAMPTFSLPWQPMTMNTPFNIDLVGPAPPGNLTVEGASTFIKLNWTINPDTDVQGYRFFCDPPPQGLPEGGIGIDAATSSSDASATCSANDASVADASGADADDADDGANDAGSSTATDAGTCTATEASTVTTCGGSKGAFFVPDTVPSLAVINAFGCGQVGGNTVTSAIVDGFSSFQTVAVAVASFDLVGNVGAFAPVSCATTEPVNGFIDLYHQAGGTAGGGFCSMTARPTRTRHNEFLYGSLILGAAFALRLRRRRTPN